MNMMNLNHEEIKRRYDLVLRKAILDGSLTCFNKHEVLSNSLTEGKEYKVVEKEDGTIVIYTNNTHELIYLKPRVQNISHSKIIVDMFYDKSLETETVKDDINEIYETIANTVSKELNIPKDYMINISPAAMHDNSISKLFKKNVEVGTKCVDEAIKNLEEERDKTLEDDKTNEFDKFLSHLTKTLNTNIVFHEITEEEYNANAPKETDKTDKITEEALPKSKHIEMSWLYDGKEDKRIEMSLEKGYEVCMLTLGDKAIYLTEEELVEIIRVSNSFRTDMIKVKKEITSRRHDVNKAINHVALTMKQLGLTKEEYIDIILNKVK